MATNKIKSLTIFVILSTYPQSVDSDDDSSKCDPSFATPVSKSSTSDWEFGTFFL